MNVNVCFWASSCQGLKMKAVTRLKVAFNMKMTLTVVGVSNEPQWIQTFQFLHSISHSLHVSFIWKQDKDKVVMLKKSNPDVE